MIVSLPSSTPNVGEMLTQQYAKEKECNRKMLIKIISSIRFLARQSLALREDGSGELDSNFYQMLKLKSEEDPKVNDWLKKKTNKYTSHDIQNEILKVMAMRVLRNIAYSLLSSSFITIIWTKPLMLPTVSK